MSTEKDLDDAVSLYKLADARAAELTAKLKVAEEALEFYADPETYFAIGFWLDSPCGDFQDDFEETEELGQKPGKRARVALSAIRRKDGE